MASDISDTVVHKTQIVINRYHLTEYDLLHRNILKSIRDLEELVPSSVDVCKTASLECRNAMEAMAVFTNKLESLGKVVSGGDGMAIRGWLNQCTSNIKQILAQKRQVMSQMLSKSTRPEPSHPVTQLSTQHKLMQTNVSGESPAQISASQTPRGSQQIPQSPRNTQSNSSPAGLYSSSQTGISTPKTSMTLPTHSLAAPQNEGTSAVPSAALSASPSLPTPSNPPNPSNPTNCSNPRCEALFRRFTMLSKSSEALYKQYQTTKEAYENATTHVKQLDSTIFALRNDVSTLSAAKASLEEQQSNMRVQAQRAGSLDRVIQERDANMLTLRARIGDLEREAGQYSSQITDLSMKNSQLQSQLKEATMALSMAGNNNSSGLDDGMRDVDVFGRPSKRPCHSGSGGGYQAGSGASSIDHEDNDVPPFQPSVVAPNGFVSASVKLQQERREKGLSGTGLGGGGNNLYGGRDSNGGAFNSSTGGAGGTGGIPPRRVVKFVTPYEGRKAGSSATDGNGKNSIYNKNAIQSSNAPAALKKAFGADSTAGGEAEGDDQPKTGPGGIPLDENGKMPGRLGACEPALVEIILNEMLDGTPGVRWDDIAGLEFAKKNVVEIVVWPMLRPDLFRGLRGPPKGMMLFGPPGTGKVRKISKLVTNTWV